MLHKAAAAGRAAIIAGKQRQAGNDRDQQRHDPALGSVHPPTHGSGDSHVGSIHAADEVMALQAARDVYTRRGEGVSIWVVPSASITASDPEQRDENFEPSTSKIYRHPSFYDIPDDVGHM